ncbi:aldehyde dehydrogenase (NADP(+)) [Thalassococcus sp. S3]|nr:aldehyde dehydrogenase (NADP(+)) [Thalassococcus sp. S3]QBF33473.1 aldehyde dehydrogenase (NADP(+)) [Thalassococcus sp. S3]
MLTGQHLIDGAWVGSETQLDAPDSPLPSVHQISEDQIDLAAQAARAAFRAYSATSPSLRADFLDTIAEEIDALGDRIIEAAMAESGLPQARLVGERGRTTGQLRLFAALIRSDGYPDIRHDPALPDRQPLPRPDLRLTRIPLGPVAVFGASNFPLAFSTAGGDTASALAAGCPVIVKGHPAHPATAELVARAIAKAVTRCGLPQATFQMINGAAPAAGAGLVQHPEITAVGFTGSLGAGRALFDLCAARAQPIPFYGELGSINPVFCLPKALETRGAEIGAAWVGSLTMGAGQFCTNPGVLIGVKSAGMDALEAAVIEAMAEAAPQKMLTDRICETYSGAVEELKGKIPVLAKGRDAVAQRNGQPMVFKTDAPTWLGTPDLHHEVFGAAGILVVCETVEEMDAIAEGLEGQLTATLQLDMPKDGARAQALLPVLTERAGRILCNGFPTGVELGSAMMHGGPYPASTDSRSTSVGTLAIDRWLRPVSYQNVPEELLPDHLQADPTGA